MDFDLNTGIQFMLHGCFEAPDEQWKHVSRRLDSFELFLVLDGTLYVSDDCNNYTVNAGEYIIMPPCENQHGWKPSQCRFYYFHWYADTAKGSFPFRGSFKCLDTIEKYYMLLSEDHTLPNIANHLMAALLLEIKEGSYTPSSKSTALLCKKIISYIQFASPDALKVSAIAHRFRYNEKYLTHCFTRYTGIPLKKHLKKELMKRAMHMLEYTDDSISQISEQLGYSDAHSFSHVFKNAVNLSPTQYRMKNTRIRKQ